MDMTREGSQIARQDTRRAAQAAGAVTATPAGEHAGEYLTFRLGAEEYGIDILRVQEIRSYEKPTRIANAPAFLKGVVNLRGVIVLNLRGRIVGVVVDSVSDVLQLGGDAIRPAPATNASIDTSYIVGIATAAERMLILIDIQSLMSSADMGLVDDAP